MVKRHRGRRQAQGSVKARGTVWAFDRALVGHVSIATTEGWTERVVERPTRLFHNVEDVLAALADGSPPPVALVIGYIVRDELAALFGRDEFLKIPIFLVEQYVERSYGGPLSAAHFPANVIRYQENLIEALPKFKQEVLDRQ
jgi:hypothetical protein